MFRRVSCEYVAASLLKRKEHRLPTTLIHWSTLIRKEVNKANQFVNVAVEEKKASVRGHYINYTDADRARISKYAAQNGIAGASRYFASTWNTNIPES